MQPNFLKKAAPTWYCSPARRAIQSFCFLLFLVLFFYVCWPYSSKPSGDMTRSPDSGDMTRFPAVREIGIVSPEAAPVQWPSHYADSLRAREVIPADGFLALDPLVSLSTALAARAWVWSLAWAGVMLGLCLLVPRGFCGYVCPLGTLLDLFDWALSKHVTRWRLQRDGWWVHLKYYLLLATLVASLCGVLLSGFVAAIPVLTRGLMFVLAPLQLGFIRGWHQVPPLNAGHAVSIALFLGVLAAGFWRPRFWCRHVCPSGAVFSVFNFWRVNERKVAASCIHCNQCVKICQFDAIKADFTTRTADCAFCQTCGGICPKDAIKFTGRWGQSSWPLALGSWLKRGVVAPTATSEEARAKSQELRAKGQEPRAAPDGSLFLPNSSKTHEIPLARRGFLAGTLSSLLLALGMRRVFGSVPGAAPFVRPPGSVPEEQFLQLCIRCGECFKVCPNSVLQPVGFEGGLDALWTPKAAANWAGCEASCNACGQVCPTGAVRALPLKEKRVARMGLAIVNLETCLPHAGRAACQMCVDECAAAGYNAIEFERVRVETGDDGAPVEGSGFVAPVVVPEKCVGCGLCQTRCYQINVKSKGWLRESAIIVAAGVGKEDRLLSGSYLELRKLEAARRQQEQQEREKKSSVPPGKDAYLPDFLK